MTRKKTTNKQKLITDQNVDNLLTPVVRILASSGLSKTEILTSVELILSSMTEEGATQTIGVLRENDTYREMISKWTTSPAYLDEKGLPRTLGLRGKAGFSALLRSVNENASIPEAVAELKKYGNIDVGPDGKLKLLKNFLHVSSPNSIAFEPHFQFLSRASTATGVLSSRNGRLKPENFWRAAETIDLPKEKIPEFLAFSKARSMDFLQELDEWLRAHSEKNNSVKKRFRAGIGLFSFFEESI
ncbi:MAG: hypothetical protein RLZZ393_1802 [Pseudomonadota bacterium]